MTSGSVSKRRKASAKPRSSEYRVVTLDAHVWVPPDGPKWEPGPEELANIVKVTPRTLRTWHEYGLPHRKHRNGRVTYPCPAALQWAGCWQARMKAGYGAAPLSMEDALEWELEQQRRMDKQSGGGPEWWCLVPLDHGHPAREAQLRKAAAGRRWRGFKLVELTPEEVAAGEMGEA